MGNDIETVLITKGGSRKLVNHFDVEKQISAGWKVAGDDSAQEAAAPQTASATSSADATSQSTGRSGRPRGSGRSRSSEE